MDNPLISIVVVTWNREAEVLETIRSVAAQDHPRFEIIVVDNCSSDATVESIRKKYPAVRLIELDRNYGPTGGRNAGVKAAQGQIILCLDSDISPAPGLLQHLAWRFEQEPVVGVINSKILNFHTGKFDQNAGWAYSEKQKKNSDRPFYTHTFSEGGCAVRKEVFEIAGMFWEKLFFGREGEEFSLRILDAGYKILYDPGSVVYHRADPEKRRASNDRKYYNLRNSLYIYLVRYPWWLAFGFVPLKILAASIQGLRRGNGGWVRDALREVIKELPALRAERHPIQNATARMYLGFQKEQGALSWNLLSWIKYKT